MAQPPKKLGFLATVLAAIADIIAHGYDTTERVANWVFRIRLAAQAEFVSAPKLAFTLAKFLKQIYTKQIDKGAILKHHKGVPLFTLENVKPELRSALDKSIVANANLIKLNRDKMVNDTLRRFEGWTTSVPAGGTKVADKADIKEEITKSFKQLPFEERRVIIDQGHKLTASLNQIIADDNNAIAAKWRSNWRQLNYNFREDHKERDEKVYAIRGNWALQKGLMNKGAGYTDEITKPAEEPFCFPGDSEIPFADGVVKAYRRWYSGELTTLVMESGKTIRATPNHPILTPHGWRAIGLLDKGDDVFQICQERIQRGYIDNNESVSTISEIFGALNKVGSVISVAGSVENFHGDGSNGNVYIVNSARPLMIGAHLLGDQRSAQFRLPKTGNMVARSCASIFGFFRIFYATSGFMCSGGKFRSPDFAFAGHAEEVCGGSTAYFDAHGPQMVVNGTMGNAKPSAYGKGAFSRCIRGFNALVIERFKLLFNFRPDVHTKRAQSSPQSGNGESKDRRYLGNAFPLPAQIEKIIDVERTSYAGHVYNLETLSGEYVAGATISHNCRCFYEYIYSLQDLPPAMLTAKGRDAEAFAAATQKAAS